MNHRGKWMIFLSMLVVATTSLLISNGQQKGLTKAARDEKAIEDEVAKMPVVAFEDAEQEAARNPYRDAKSRRHNSLVSAEDAKRIELNDNSEPLIISLPLTHTPTEPAIPVKSNLIVIGFIDDAKVYLSSDKTALYSEVTIRVEQILKGAVRYGVVSGSTLTAERYGGAVRFSSGKILRRANLGKNIPSKGYRYLLFLNEIQEVDGFVIVTGYKLQDGTAFPLDGVDGSDGGFPQFAAYETYKNANESTLIEDVRTAVAKEGN